MRRRLRPPANRPPTRPAGVGDRAGRDARALLIVVSAAVALLVLLRLVAAGGESAGGPGPVRIPTPALTAAEACATWARYWMVESGVGADPASLEGMSSCRRAEGGEWFVPRGATDPRLPEAPILTSQERARTAELRQTLLAQIDALKAEFPRGLQRQLSDIYDPVNRPVTGHLKDGVPISAVRGRYTRLTQAFLMAPNRRELADYVGWFMGHRIAAFDDFLDACDQPDLQYLRVACEGLEGSLSIRYPPWPWQLTDPLLLDSYLDWALANGRVPASEDA